MSRADGAARLLSRSVRLLPIRQREWGRAMLAELAAIESRRARWRFALSCTRAALTVPSALLELGRRLLMVGVVAGALVLAAQIRFAGVRAEVMGMVAVLVAVSWLARHALFGPLAAGRTARVVSGGGLAVIAAEALIFINEARLSSPSEVAGRATALIVVWTTMLMIYTLALARVTARRSRVATRTMGTGAGVAVAAAAVWLIAVVAHPSVPSSSGPALVAIAAAAVGAELVGARRGRGAQNRLAGLAAAAGAALLIAVMIDGPLRLFSTWVPNSAPPFDPGAANRLVDSVGIWLLGCLLATALTLATTVVRPHPARLPRHEEGGGVHPPRGVRADPE